MPHSPQTVVVVNDSLAQCKLLVDLLRKEGLQARGFENAEQALPAMQADKPDLIVTDLYMPGLDGWRFCRLLRSPEYRAFNQTPILVVSATFSGEETERLTTETGANAFLALPQDIPHFRDTVTAMLQGSFRASQPRVLLVEDGTTLAKLLKRTFEAHGYLADTALTACEAVEMFENRAYDVAIIDYHLPDGQGDDLLEDFGRTSPNCVCLMMTSDPQPGLALECMKKGAAAYLRKPFAPEYAVEVCAKARRERTLLRVEDRLEQRTGELRESMQRYGELFETAPVGIFQTHPEGWFLSVNPELARLAGYDTPATMIAEITDIARQLYVRPPEREELKAHLARRGHVLHYEVEWMRRDGQRFWVSLNVKEKKNKDGQVTYNGFLTDITALKEAEAERQKLEAQLRHAHKMEAVGTLAGGIAHDFNNLLQGISGYAQLLLARKSSGSPDFKGLNHIQQACERAKSLIRQMLVFSRKMESDSHPMDVNQEILETHKLLTQTIPRMIEIEMGLSGELWPVHADPVQVQQVLLNLCGNAADAMPDGGRLSIETRNARFEQEQAHAFFKIPPGDYVHLSTSDTGMGMSEEVRQKVFDPFFTTKEAGKGTGLGLASVYGIVKSLNGYILCSSSEGAGSTFSIYLPALVGHKLSEDVQSAQTHQEGGRETILVVDDEEALREITQEALEEFGYTVLHASSGEEALALYAKRGREIDLVLLDLNMPGMGGLKCMRKLLTRDPDIRILIASGYTAQGHVRDVLYAGAKGFIAKPYKLRELADKVRESLKG